MDDERREGEKMSQFIREIEHGVELFRDAVTGIAWAEDHRSGLRISVHPNIDESGSIEGMISSGRWRSGDRIAKLNGWFYDIDRFSCDEKDVVEVIVAEECMCPACIERRAANIGRERYECPVCHNTEHLKGAKFCMICGTPIQKAEEVSA